MFPWESAASGQETCPTSAGTGLREIHISGDIAIAVEMMFEATGSKSWLASTGFPIVSQVAEMWCSRAVASGDDNMLHINDVIPPDEYSPARLLRHAHVALHLEQYWASYNTITFVAQVC
jgi:trehalose/maltose hydrolase-like predicted phosphorylase